MRASSSDSTLAVFLDLENIALGARDAHYEAFDIRKVLEQLLLKGHIVVKKAYCDFDRYRDFKRGLHEAAFELIEIPHVRQSGKNSADIRMVVDALDLCYTKGHVDTFAIISGDSDFSPLVSKLRENAKTVIGVGVKNSTSDLFINNCDEFIYYDDLVRDQPRPRRGGRPPRGAENGGHRSNYSPASSGTPGGPGSPASSGSPALSGAPGGQGAPVPTNSSAPPPPFRPERSGRPDVLPIEKVLDELMETLEALSHQRGADEPVWASMIKQTIRRRNPGFNERAFGFGSFNELLHEAEKRGLLMLNSERSGSYTVRLAEMREDGESGRGATGEANGGSTAANAATDERQHSPGEETTDGEDQPSPTTTIGERDRPAPETERQGSRRGGPASSRRRRPGIPAAREAGGEDANPMSPERASNPMFPEQEPAEAPAAGASDENAPAQPAADERELFPVEAVETTAGEAATTPTDTEEPSAASDTPTPAQEPSPEEGEQTPTAAKRPARGRRPRRQSATGGRSTRTRPPQS